MLLFQVKDSVVFTPNLSDLWLGAWGSLVIFVVLAIGGVILYRRKTADARIKIVLPMFLYMLSLMALVSAGGYFLSTFKYPVIEISKTKILVDGKAYPHPLRGQQRLETVEDRLGGPSTRILLLQLKGGSTIAIPDDRYKLEEMMGLLSK